VTPPGCSFCLSSRQVQSHMPTTCQPNDRSLHAVAGQRIRTDVRTSSSERAFGVGGAIVCSRLLAEDEQLDAWEQAVMKKP
jgi:hypothetical protein